MVFYVGTKGVLQNTSSIKDAVIHLNCGISMPIIGLGTYQVYDQELIFKAVDSALRFGYRAFDTATVYGNESFIGGALKTLLPKYNLRREEIFITSKLSPKDQGKERVRAGVEGSLARLGLDYIDLYLIHWPGTRGLPVASPGNQTLRRESWEGLVSLRKEGRLRAIGVSNYTASHLRDLLQHSSTPPALNQVEFHPYFRHPDELLELCAQNNILLQAYSSFGGSGETRLINDSTIAAVSEKLNVNPPQVLLRWALQHGFGIIPKTVHEERIKENISLDFKIPEEDMTLINNISVRNKFAWDPESVY